MSTPATPASAATSGQSIALTNSRTQLLCLAFGWQGGTVHQVAKATGCDPSALIYEPGITHHEDNTGGWLAFRTCSRAYRETLLYPKYKGNLQFWDGVCRAVQISLQLGDLETKLS